MQNHNETVYQLDQDCYGELNETNVLLHLMSGCQWSFIVQGNISVA